MCTILIEALTPLNRTSCIKMSKNNARSRLFRRIAKRSIKALIRIEFLRVRITIEKSNGILLHFVEFSNLHNTDISSNATRSNARTELLDRGCFFMYSRVPNNRPPRLINFSKNFPTPPPPALIPSPLLLIF